MRSIVRTAIPQQTYNEGRMEHSTDALAVGLTSLAVDFDVIFRFIKLNPAVSLPLPFLQYQFDLVAEISQRSSRKRLPSFRGWITTCCRAFNFFFKAAKIG